MYAGIPTLQFEWKMAQRHYQSVKHNRSAAAPHRPCPSRHALIVRAAPPKKSQAALAQLVEHIIRNDGVACSSHASGTTFPCEKRRAYAEFLDSGSLSDLA